MPKRFSRRAQAGRMLEEGIRLRAAGDDDAALAAYAQAARLRRDWATPWYNAGLIHKYRGHWRASFEANRRAHRLSPREPAATWNLGIAATALGEWEQARAAWRHYGMPVAAGSGPVDYFIGITPIRVSTQDAPEVVWADRIDPARAIIRSVPTPASGRRWGDLVLHDGAPVGWRMLGEQEVPVFDELDLLQPSAHATYELHVRAASDQDLQVLAQAVRAEGLAFENWSTGVRRLCKACSEGRPHSDAGHDHGPAANSSDDVVRLGLAASTKGRLEALLETWCAEHPAVRVEQLRCVLKPGHVREVART